MDFFWLRLLAASRFLTLEVSAFRTGAPFFNAARLAVAVPPADAVWPRTCDRFLASALEEFFLSRGGCAFFLGLITGLTRPTSCLRRASNKAGDGRFPFPTGFLAAASLAMAALFSAVLADQ
jgi:hypothetical protein